MVFQRRGRSGEWRGARSRDLSTSYWAGDVTSESTESSSSRGSLTSSSPEFRRLAVNQVPGRDSRSLDHRTRAPTHSPSETSDYKTLKRSHHSATGSPRKRRCPSPDQRQLASVVYLPASRKEAPHPAGPSYRRPSQRSPPRKTTVYYNSSHKGQQSSLLREHTQREHTQREIRSSPRRPVLRRQERHHSPEREFRRRERRSSPRRQILRRQEPEQHMRERPSFKKSSPARVVRTESKSINVVITNKGAARYHSNHPQGLGSLCPIKSCGIRSRTLRHHVYTAHLPYCLRDSVPASPETASTMMAAIEDLARQILGTGATWTDLHQFVLRNSLVPPNIPLRGSCVEHISQLCQMKGWPLPLDTISLPLESPACLLHWRILASLLNITSERVRVHFKNFENTLVIAGCPFPVVQATPSAVPSEKLIDPSPTTAQQRSRPPTQGIPRGFDTHFHPDRMRSRLHLDAATPLEEVMDKACQPLEGSSFDLQRAVQVFCDPSTWPQDPTSHPCWKIAIGLHPKNVSSTPSSQLGKLQNLLSSPNVVALGEVGLDFTAGDWEQQGKVLGEIFRFADPNKPIILHLRGTAADTYQRAPLQECMRIAQTAGLDSHQKFHLHCFSGSVKEMTLWTQTFPETWFGYTGMVANFDEHQLSALRFLNAKRFVLETDAPYLCPRPGRRGVNSPRLLGEVATLVAEARQSTPANILERAYINGRRLYRV